MPGLRAGIGRFASEVFAEIGSHTPAGRRATATALSAASRSVYPAGSMSRAALRTALFPQYKQFGKTAVGYGGIAASGIGMLSSNRSSGAYNPAPRPMTSAPSGVGRSA